MEKLYEDYDPSQLNTSALEEDAEMMNSKPYLKKQKKHKTRKQLKPWLRLKIHAIRRAGDLKL